MQLNLDDVTCFQLLKIASDGNFFLLFKENDYHLASVNFTTNVIC